MRAFLIAPAEAEGLESALLSAAAAIIVEDVHAASDPRRGLLDAWGAKREAPPLWGERRCEERELPGEDTPLTPRERVPSRSLYLRIRSPDEDLVPALSYRPHGLVLSCCASGRDVARLGARLAVKEAELSLPDGATRILAMVETAAGMLGLSSLPGSSPRLTAIAWDAAALAAAIGAPAARDVGGFIPPLAQMRSLVRLAAATAEVEVIDAAYPPDGDEQGFRDELASARRDGFAAKLAASRAQVAAIMTG